MRRATARDGSYPSESAAIHRSRAGWMRRWSLDGRAVAVVFGQVRVTSTRANTSMRASARRWSMAAVTGFWSRRGIEHGLDNAAPRGNHAQSRHAVWFRGDHTRSTTRRRGVVRPAGSAARTARRTDRRTGPRSDRRPPQDAFFHLPGGLRIESHYRFGEFLACSSDLPTLEQLHRGGQPLNQRATHGRRSPRDRVRAVARPDLFLGVVDRLHAGPVNADPSNQQEPFAEQRATSDLPFVGDEQINLRTPSPWSGRSRQRPTTSAPGAATAASRDVTRHGECIKHCRGRIDGSNMRLILLDEKTGCLA